MTDTSVGDDGAGMDPGDGSGDGSGNGQWETFCTLQIDRSTGKFKMYEGDEPDEGAAGGGEMAGAPPGAGPAPPGEEAGEGEPPAPDGEEFDSSAELMRAVLEVVKDAEDQGGGGEDAAMEQGFNAATPAAGTAPSPIGPNS